MPSSVVHLVLRSLYKEEQTWGWTHRDSFLVSILFIPWEILEGSSQVVFRILFQILVISCFQDFSRWNKILFRISLSPCSGIFLSLEYRIPSGFTQDPIKDPLKIMSADSVKILSGSRQSLNQIFASGSCQDS